MIKLLTSGPKCNGGSDRRKATTMSQFSQEFNQEKGLSDKTCETHFSFDAKKAEEMSTIKKDPFAKLTYIVHSTPLPKF